MIHLLMAAMLAAPCAASPQENPFPGVVGPLTGQSPAWMVDGNFGRWSRPDEVVKTLWVFSRKASGPLRITGRQLDGMATARFQDGVDGQRTDVLEVADPWKWSVIPGGASADVLRSYSFMPYYVIYPSRGCWEFTVQLGSDTTRIVLDFK